MAAVKRILRTLGPVDDSTPWSKMHVWWKLSIRKAMKHYIIILMMLTAHGICDDKNFSMQIEGMDVSGLEKLLSFYTFEQPDEKTSFPAFRFCSYREPTVIHNLIGKIAKTYGNEVNCPPLSS